MKSSFPRLIALAISLTAAMSVAITHAAETYTWTGGGGDANWGTSANWTNNANPDGSGSQAVDIYFGGSTDLTPFNNYSAYCQFQQIIFQSGASSFTLSGSAIKLYNWGGTAKIENQSSNLQTVSLSQVDFVGTGELDPTAGNLTINSSVIDDAGGEVRVWGNNGNTLTLNGYLGNGSGTLNFVNEQNNNVVMTASNTYTGYTTQYGGNLILNQGAYINNSSQIYLGGTNAIGAATTTAQLTLAGTNQTLTPGITQQSGTITLVSSALSGTNTVSGNISLANGITLSSSSGGTLALSSGVISGAGSVAVTGAGTVTLSGANTFSGGTTLSAGTLTLGASSTPTSGTVTSGPLGTGTLTLAGGTLTFGAAYNVGNAINVTAATIIEASSSGNDQLNGNITGAGNLTDAANSITEQIQLGGTNSGYSGTFTENSGNTSLQFNSASAGSAAAAWVFNNGTSQRTRFNFGTGTINFGSLAGSGNLANLVSGTTTLSVGALGASTTFSGVMAINGSDNLALTLVGGALNLTGVNTFTGGTTITTGTLTIGGAGQLGSGSYAGSISDAGTFIYNSSAAQTLSGAISGAGALTQSGAGTLTLSASNSYSGGTTIGGGTLQLSNSNALGTGPATITASGGVLDFHGSSISNPLGVTASGTFTNSSATAVTVSGSLGTSTSTLSAFTVNGAGNITFTGPMPLTANTDPTITVNGSNIVEFEPSSEGEVDGATSVTVTSGTAILGATGNFVGFRNATVNGGVLQFDPNHTTTSAGENWAGQIQNHVTITTGTFDLNGTGGQNDYMPYIQGTGGVLTNSSATPATLTLAQRNNGAFTLASTISGGINLTVFQSVTGGNTETLTGNNALWTGTATLSSGTTVLGNQNAMENITVSVGSTNALGFNNSLSGGSAYTIGALSGASNLALSDTGGNAVALTVGGNGNSTTYSGALSGGGSLIKTGTGSNLTLSSSNSFTGGLTITSGSVTATAAGALGGGTITLGSGAGSSAATLISNVGTTDTNAITVTAGGTGVDTIQNSNGGDLHLNGNIALNNALTFATPGGGAIFVGGTITGSSQITVTNCGGKFVDFSANNASTYTGNVSVISGGDLKLGSAAAFGSSTVLTFDSTSKMDMGGDSLTIAGLNDVVNGAGGSVVLDNGSGLTLAGAGNYSFSGSIQNGGYLTMSGAGTQILSGTNIFTGGVNINGGTLEVNATETAGTSGPLGKSGNITFGGGTLEFTSADTYDYSSRIAAGTSTGAISINTNGQNVTFGTAFTSSQSGGLTKLGAGKLTLTAANAYTGATTITSGTLQLGNGGTTGSIPTGSTITDNGALVFDRSNAVTQNTDFANTIGGTGSITQAGTGSNLTLSSSNGFSGGLTILTGTVTQTGSNALGTGTINLGDGSTSNSASLVDNYGSGNLVNSNAISVAAGGSGVYTIADINGRDYTFTGNIALGNALTFKPTNGGAIFIQGTMTGSSQITIDGGGTTTKYVDFSGNSASSYTGNVLVQNKGDFKIGNASAFGSTTVVTMDSTSTMDLGHQSSLTIAGLNDVVTGAGGSSLIDYTSGSGLVLAGGGSYSFSGSISSNGGLTMSGAGTQALSGTNTFTGALNINGGILVANSAETAGTSGPLGETGNITFGGGTLEYSTANAYDYSSRIAAGTSTGPISINTNGQSVTFGTALTSSQSGGLTKLGAGTLTLTAADGYTGATTITSGTLQLGNGGTTGSIPTGSTITDNGALVFDRSNAVTQNTDFANTIGGTGSITQAGTGNLTLSSSNSFSGGLTITNGTVTQTGSNALGAGTITLGDGSSANPATLADNYGTAGLVNTNAVTVAAGGSGVYTIADNNIRDYTFTGNIALGNALTFKPTNGGAIFIQGTMTGSSQITVDGGGTTTKYVDFSGNSASTYTGNVLVQNKGDFKIGNASAFGSTTVVTMDSTSTMDLGHQSSLTIAGLNDVVTGAGGSSLIDYTSGSGLVLAGGGTYSYAGSISSNGGLTMYGVGTQTLSGSSTYTGATTVTNGTLIVSGSLSGTVSASVSGGANLEVDGLVNLSATDTVSGTLSGTGKVGAITANGGTIEPGLAVANTGSSTGALTASGAVTLSGSTNFSIRLGLGLSGTDSDQLVATSGSGVSLNGANLQLTLNEANMNPPAGPAPTFYAIILGGAELTGSNGNVFATYNGATISNNSFSTADGWQFTILYAANADGSNVGSGNDVVLELTAVPEPGAWAMMLGGLGMLITVQRMRRRNY